MAGNLPASGKGDGDAWQVSNTPLHLLLILLAGVACYANTLQVPFVLDDRTSIVENHLIKNLPAFFTDFAGFTHNPRRFIGYLTFALNHEFGGLQVRGYHLFNLGVHLLTAVLVYCFCRLTCKSPFMERSRLARLFPLVALAAALVFVSHPLQTQAVTYVSQRVASLATLFYLLSLTCHARARQLQADGASPLRLVLLWCGSLAAALLAMMTKETAFTLPLMLLVYDRYFFPGPWRKRLLLLVPLIVPAVLLLPLSLRGLSEGGIAQLSSGFRAASGISRLDYLLTQLRVVTTYVRLLFLPMGQNLDYDYRLSTSLFEPAVIGSFLFLAGLLAVALLLLRRCRQGGDPSLRLVSFGIVWFFIALGVESSIIPITDVIFEHRLYLPSVGFALIVAVLLVLAMARHGNRAVMAGTLLITCILGTATWRRNLVWGDESTLWRDTVSKSPGKDRPHANLGKALLQKGRVDEGVRELETALALNPGNGEAWSNLGAADLKKGDYEAAQKHLLTAVNRIPGNFAARYNLGLALSRTGQVEQAAGQFLVAVQFNPDSAEAHNQLAVACASIKLPACAIEQFREAVRMNPGKTEYVRNLELALRQLQSGRQ